MKKNFLLYLIQFYTGFLSQSRHLQIEVGADDFGTWTHPKQKKKQKIFSTLVAPSRTRKKDFY